MLDLTKCKRPKTAATKLYKYLCKLSKLCGQTPEMEVKLLSPEDSDRLGYGKCWRVMWESGPFEWAVCLSGGESLYGSEGMRGDPEVNIDSRDWFCEPYYSFDLGFYPV